MTKAKLGRRVNMDIQKFKVGSPINYYYSI